jgi:FixJ family two-component response regulator
MPDSVLNSARRSAGAGPVILVEDDDDLRAAITFSLEVEGLQVAAFKAGEDLLGNTPLDCGCLVIDYWLPGLNGLALLARLRALGVHAPALLITTYPSAFLRARAQSAGAQILEKPLRGDAIVQAVRDATAIQ